MRMEKKTLDFIKEKRLIRYRHVMRSGLNQQRDREDNGVPFWKDLMESLTTEEILADRRRGICLVETQSKPVDGQKKTE